MKKLHTIVVLAALFLTGLVPATAQNNGKQRISREQLAERQALHIAGDTALALDEATTRKFVKTFCDYQKEIWALGPRIPNVDESMTDAEAEAIMQQRFERSEKILAIREKYYKKYSEYLSPKQIQKVYELERVMMRRMSDRRRADGKQ